ALPSRKVPAIVARSRAFRDAHLAVNSIALGEGGIMKIRSLSLAVVCVLGLTGSALAQRGRAFVEARGGALIPVGHFSHEDDPGGAYSIAAGYEFLPYLDGIFEFTHAFNENDQDNEH